jgi:hypothetical protein
MEERMNRFVRLSSVALTVLGAGCSNSEVTTLAPPPGSPIPIVRLRSEPFSFSFVSGFDKPARLVVRDAATWQAIWTQIFRGGSVPPLPAIDFSSEMVVVTALGSHSSGGYGILIEGASEAGANGVAIAVRSISPGPTCGVTAAFTQPVDVARMPRRDGPVSFIERNEVNNCG